MIVVRREAARGRNPISTMRGGGTCPAASIDRPVTDRFTECVPIIRIVWLEVTHRRLFES